MNHIRQRFEQWAAANGWPLKRADFGGPKYPDETQCAWRGYQAAAEHADLVRVGLLGALKAEQQRCFDAQELVALAAGFMDPSNHALFCAAVEAMEVEAMMKFERRLAEVESGRATLVPAEDAIQRARQAVEKPGTP